MVKIDKAVEIRNTPSLEMRKSGEARAMAGGAGGAGGAGANLRTAATKRRQHWEGRCHEHSAWQALSF
jgi:hypothetical protein